MTDDLMLRRTWTLRAHGRQVVFIKKRQESREHVIMKALLWALYLPDSPQLQIELSIGDRYRPDVVQLDPTGHSCFWGKAGQVGLAKIGRLVRRYPSGHLAFARWATRLEPLLSVVAKALANVRRSAPFDLVSFPADSAERFIDGNGTIRLTHADLNWRRLS